MAYKYKITYQTKKWGKLIKNRLKRFNDFDEAVALCKKINKEYENVKKIRFLSYTKKHDMNYYIENNLDQQVKDLQKTLTIPDLFSNAKLYEEKKLIDLEMILKNYKETPESVKRENRKELKENIVKRLMINGDCLLEFQTKDINELINWIEELEKKVESNKNIISNIVSNLL